MTHKTDHMAGVARRNKAYRQQTRERLAAYLAEHPCVDCGETDIRCLEFDHRDRREKVAPVSILLLRQILISVVLNTLIALPVYLVCRRVMAPYLPDDPRRRRRRAYTTGGLSPLTRA